MIAPQVLNNCNMILDGMSMAGRVLELTLPKIAIKKEDYRAGGMDGPISMDQGMEQMEFGFSISGVTKEAMGKMALVDGLAYDTEFRGAFMDWRGKVVSATAIMRGRLWELDPGKWKPGDKGESQVKGGAAYYKLILDGQVFYEFDPVACIRIIQGVDQMQEVRNALGI